LLKSSSRILLTVFITLSLLCAFGCSNSQEQDAAAKELRTVITEITSFIEVGDYEGLFEKYAAPADLNRMKMEGTLDKAIRRFALWKNEMLTALKEALTTMPTFNADKTQATFEVENAPTPLIFTKIDGRWYFADKS